MSASSTVSPVTVRHRRQSRTRKELMSAEILNKASAVMADRGFANTSLQDVANALGMSRSSLYHYIGSKEQLLAMLVRGLTRETADDLTYLASMSELAPTERLETAIRHMIVRIARNAPRFRLLLASEGSLPSKLAREHAAARREVLRGLTTIISAGIEQNLLRRMDGRTAALGVLGICNWVAWWYDPDRPEMRDVDRMASDLANLALAGLLETTNRIPAGPPGVLHAVNLLRQDLEYLQQALSSSSPLLTDPSNGPHQGE